ncbi:MAG: hypothetical protein IKH57_10685 [Clostridia bacterium]|nr:hypothetical protein [Clostridia bacterium]MBR6861943.1 hypothetical protein [Acidaminococcaceae bacterium]
MALLANLYSHIRGSQEDIATYSLQYILSEASELNQAFTRLASEALFCHLPPSLNYACQAAGENSERPDIAGVDSNGTELLLCEAKFYAGLTSNQPNAYLDRLIRKNGVGLLFICPAVRKQVLWGQLLDLVSRRSVKCVSDFCVAVDEAFMSIITWGDVISTLRRAANAYAVECLSDIDQLAGFCQQMDSDAFIPFSAEDLGPDVARKEERYYRVIDELVDYLKSDKSLMPSTKGVKATAYRKGYGRGIRIKNYWLSINYDRDLWGSTSTTETPFWVAIRSGSDWKQSDYYLKAFLRIPSKEKGSMWGLTYVALHPVLNGTINDVVKDMKEQILCYIDLIEEEKERSGIEE